MSTPNSAGFLAPAGATHDTFPIRRPAGGRAGPIRDDSSTVLKKCRKVSESVAGPYSLSLGKDLPIPRYVAYPPPSRRRTRQRRHDTVLKKCRKVSESVAGPYSLKLGVDLPAQRGMGVGSQTTDRLRRPRPNGQRDASPGTPASPRTPMKATP